LVKIGPTMKTVNIHEAKTHLSRLVAEAAEGEEIVIAKAGRPVAKLTRIGHARKGRPLGTARGEVVIRADFDAPLPKEIRKAFGA
jgi:prevent-host-death family protein